MTQKKPCVISGLTRRYFTAEDRVQSQVCPNGICCEGTGICARFSPRTLGDTGVDIPVPIQYYPNSMILLVSSTNLIIKSVI